VTQVRASSPACVSLAAATRRSGHSSGVRTLPPRHRPRAAAPPCAGPVLVGALVSRDSAHPVPGGLRWRLRVRRRGIDM